MSNNVNKGYLYWRSKLYKKIPIRMLQGRAILDIGCGTGEDAYVISKIAKKVEAFDIQSYDEWKQFESPNLKFTVADAYRIPFKSNSFDGIFLKDVLHHVGSPEKILKEIDRVGKKGSSILIVEGNRYNPIFYIHMTMIRRHEHLSKEKFRKLIEKYFHNVEFRQFESHYIPFLSFPLYVLIEGIIEKIFESLPLLNRLKSYNLAIIKK